MNEVLKDYLRELENSESLEQELDDLEKIYCIDNEEVENEK